MNDLNLPIILAEFLAKSAVVIVLGFVILAAVRKIFPAAAKHGLWLRVFVASLAIPILLLVFPRWEIMPVFQKPDVIELPDASEASQSSITAESTEAQSRSAAPVAKAKSKVSLSQFLIVVWAGGVAFLMARAILAAVYLRKVERDAVPADGKLFQGFTKLNDAPERGTTLLISSLVASPFTWGIVRPRIVLPEAAASWSPEDLEMILLHELEHVRRRDALAVFVSRIFLALNWANPLAWIANRDAIRLREEACDARVIRAGHASESYAEMLFRQAQLTTNPFLQTCATAVAETGTIEQRIKMILNSKRLNLSAESQSPAFARILTTVFIGLFAVVGMIGPQKSEAQAEARKESDEKIKVDDKWKTLTIPSVQFADTPLEDAFAFLSQRSVELDPKREGVNLVLRDLSEQQKATRISLKLKNVPVIEAIRYSCALGQVGFKVEQHAIVITPEIVRAGADDAKPDGTIEAKLKAIVIPKIEFRDVPFSDALQFLEQRSVELDPEKDRNAKGVNFIMKNAGEIADTQITLRLSNVPLSEALRYTCELAQFEYKIEPHSVVIQPKTIGKKP